MEMICRHECEHSVLRLGMSQRLIVLKRVPKCRPVRLLSLVMRYEKIFLTVYREEISVLSGILLNLAVSRKEHITRRNILLKKTCRLLGNHARSLALLMSRKNIA